MCQFFGGGFSALRLFFALWFFCPLFPDAGMLCSTFKGNSTEFPFCGMAKPAGRTMVAILQDLP